MIVLASTSPTRQGLLSRAGVTFRSAAPEIDEAVVKAGEPDTRRAAMLLAEQKAGAVAAVFPGAVVIGADQMLDCEGIRFDKPNDRSAARHQLLALRGRRHRLITAVAVATAADGVLWRHCEEASLTMRRFSDAFADGYLAETGDAVLSSVGAYQLEGRGAQLFERVDGDFFTILGLPLLALLEFLRSRGDLPS